MIRILHVLNGMDYGGVESFIMNVYRHINRDEIQFDFLVHTNKKCAFDDEIISLGGLIYRVPSRKGGIKKNRIALKQFFSEHTEYKIVHQHLSSLSYLDPLKIAQKKGVKYRIVHGHSTKQNGHFLHYYLHLINRFLVNYYATEIFACSKEALRWINGNKNKGIIIKNGIEAEKFTYNSELRNIVRGQLQVDGKFVIGHVGRFAYPKNHHFLVDVFYELIKLEPNSMLLLVGSGELQPMIKKKVEELKIRDQVIFLGLTSEVSSILQAMDMFMFPSVYEGLGIALIEAQASGLKCIVSDSVPEEVRISNLVEFMSINDEPATWAKKIISEFDYSRNNTHNYITESGYEITIIAKKLEKIYQGLV